MNKSPRIFAVLLFSLTPVSLQAANAPTVPDGPPIGAPGGAYDPVTVGDYLAMCETLGSKLSSADGKMCTFPLDYAAAWELQNNNKALCLKSAPSDSPEIFNSVMAWLKAHPELRDRKKEDGAQLALNSLYPCPHN